MKKFIAISASVLGVIAAVFYIHVAQTRIWLKAEELKIKEEIAIVGASSNYEEGVEVFLEHGSLVSYKTDGWTRYHISMRPRITRRDHDGWVSKQADGTYYVKIW